MACNDKKKFKTSEASTKSAMRTRGAIDKSLNIKNLPLFRSLNKEWSDLAKEKYNETEMLFFEQNGGKKALPNTKIFQSIDKKKGINYKENEYLDKKQETQLGLDFNNEKELKEHIDTLYQIDESFLQKVFSNENVMLLNDFKNNDLMLENVDVDKNSVLYKYMEFVGKNIKSNNVKDIAVNILKNEFKIKYYGLQSKPISNEIELSFIALLDEYKIGLNIESKESLKERFGLNIMGALDIVNKQIYISKERNYLTLAEEVAHATVELMGGVFGRQKETTQLLKLVQSWEGYSTIHNEYSKVYAGDWKKITKEAVGKAIAIALVSENTLADNSTLAKIRQIIKKFLAKFLNSYKKALNNEKFKELVNKIAKDIVENPKSFKKDIGNVILTNYNETIEAQNAYDGGIVLNLMNLISKFNGAITGSLALRKVSSVYRKNNGDLHDVDAMFNITDVYENENQKKSVINNPELFFYGTKIGKALKGLYGSKIANWSIYKKKNGDINHHFLIAINDNGKQVIKRMLEAKKITGYLSIAYDALTKEEQKDVVLLDLFAMASQVDSFTDEDYGIKLTTPYMSYRAKMFDMGIDKDVYDYQNLEYSKEFEIEDNKNIMFQVDNLANEFDNKTELNNEDYVAYEKTIRDLSEKLANRIGTTVKFENDKTLNYQSKIENDVVYVNLASATLTTPVHSILSLPIIKAFREENEGLYKNLLQALQNPTGREILNRLNSENDNDLQDNQEIAIAELLSLYTTDKLNQYKDRSIIELFKGIFKKISAFLKSILKAKELEIANLPENMTIMDLANLFAYSKSNLLLPNYQVTYTTPNNNKFKTYDEASNHITNLIKEFNSYDQEKIDNIINNIEANEIDNNDFIDANNDFEKSKQIIEKYKKVNDIIYNPQEVYSRGHEFISVIGAYTSFDVNLMMQNLLEHISDNKKAGTKFTISAFTRPVNTKVDKLETGGSKIRFKIQPKPEDIEWAANKDCYSGSSIGAAENINSNVDSEVLGVSYTKSPSMLALKNVQPNLANIIDNIADRHNELGITLTGENFRLEYDADIFYETKQILNSINAILEQRYGKFEKEVVPELSNERFNLNQELFLLKIDKKKADVKKDKEASEKLNNLINKLQSKIDNLENIGIVPVKNNNNITTSIEEIKNSFETEEVIFTEKATNNLRIAALKQFAKKYPRILITSKVEKIGKVNVEVSEKTVKLPEIKKCR